MTWPRPHNLQKTKPRPGWLQKPRLFPFTTWSWHSCLLLILFIFRASWLPWWLSSKESGCQWKRHGFYPWVRKFPWRRKWQPTPVFLPGNSHGQRSLVGYSLQGCKRVSHDWATKQWQQGLVDCRPSIFCFVFWVPEYVVGEAATCGTRVN